MVHRVVRFVGAVAVLAVGAGGCRNEAAKPALVSAGPSAATSLPTELRVAAAEDMPGCPADVTCIATLPFVARGTTVASTRADKDRYACDRLVDESGPEVWYRVGLAEPGFVALELSNMPEGADVDVYLLDAQKECITRGDDRAGALLEAGSYWVVVDTWVSKRRGPRPGAFTINVGHTKVTDLAAAGLSAPLADTALRVFAQAWKKRKTQRFEYAVTDFSLHSSKKRQWIFDLKTGKLLWHLHVAHGEGSSDATEPGFARTFSDRNATHQSSLGLMKTGERYVGTFGPSYRLDGLEQGVNKNVRDRAIVVHPWSGSRDSYVSAEGSVQPTWGCPAIDDRLAEEVRQRMAGGALMWFWAPDPTFLSKSRYLTQR